MSLTVSYKVGDSSVYGNVVARNQFTAAQQAAMDAGQNVAGYAAVDGHFTYVGAGATGQDAYNRVYGTSTSTAPTLPDQGPADPTPVADPASGAPGAPPVYTNQPAKGSWMTPVQMTEGSTTFNPGSPAAYSVPGNQTGTGTGTATGPKVDPNALANMNALELLTREFINFGLFDGPNDPRLAPFRAQISSWLTQGYDATTIALMLQDTQVYKDRFSGNEARKANGLAVLSPAEYLASERAYKQVFAAYGLPSGFYDDHAKLADMIGRDVSPSEINDRVKSAVDFVNNSDPLKRQELALYFPELGTGDLVANFLDPKAAKPLLDKKIAATGIGYQAARQGLSSPGVNDALRYADLGVTEADASQAYGEIAGFLPTEQKIGNRFNNPYTQTDAEQELLGGMASAKRKRDQLNNDEQALFAGSGGLGSTGLKQNTSGSY